MAAMILVALVVLRGSRADVAPNSVASNSAAFDDETALLQTALLQHSLTVQRGEGHKLAVQRAVDVANSTQEECKALIARLDALDVQNLTNSVGSDPLFPPTMVSIGHSGDCGDSAAGISESCAKYNEWHTFQDYNCKDLPGSESGKKWLDGSVTCSQYAGWGWCEKYGDTDYGEGPATDYCCDCGGGDRNVPMKVIGPSGIQFSDIDQGQLGDCYFLAALASIAYTVPSVIDDMFVERHLWTDNIFKTKWLVNGKETIVSVDNMIPGTANKVWFVPKSPTGEFWPVILEKAWAKIYGSFSKVEGGQWTQAVGALTRAPLVRLLHDEVTKDDVWNAIKTATSKKWPMGCGTNSERDAAYYGLAEGHQYSALEAFEKDGKKYVKCFNPWREDYYEGSVENANTSDGVFDMTLDEYHAAFVDTDIAKVMPDYKITSMPIPSGLDYNAISMQVTDCSPVYVSITWPGSRMVEPCPVPDPDISFAVAKKEWPHNAFMEATYGNIVSSANTANLEISGPGEYQILAGVAFPDNSWIDEVSLTVYAKQDITFVRDAPSTAAAAAHSMLKFTEDDCECKREWSLDGIKCTSFCCNPDNDKSDWCYVKDTKKASCGHDWGYCKV